MVKHNKKRNVGLLHEFFARYMVSAILDNRDKDLQKSRNLVTKFFNDTKLELHTEFCLFNTILETSTKSREAAYALLSKVKEVCSKQDANKLEQEKTNLLCEIHQQLGDKEFFDQQIDNYKDIATIQVLFNSWRSKSLQENLGEQTQLEERLVDLMVSNKMPVEVEDCLSMTNEDVDKLVVSIMQEKVEEKYKGLLNGEQKNILNLYVLSDKDTSSKKELVGLLENLRLRTLKRIESTPKDSNKLLEVKEMLEKDYKDTSNVADDNIINFYMSISKLESELV